jgi:hypothetical protein
VSEIMNQFRDEELPASTVDISGAVRAGRRRRRIRTGLAAGFAVVALAVAGATAPTLLSAQPGPGPVPPGEPNCSSPEPARPALPTWQQFDPLVYEIDTSGVAGYHLKITATSTYWQLAHLESDNADQAVEPGVIFVLLFACGGEPHVFNFDADQAVALDPDSGEPADPINGAPAYWLPPNSQLPGGSPTEGLAWQWTPGAWAIVFTEPDDLDNPDVDTAALRGVAGQVAPQLQFGVGARVTAPFSLSVPDGTHPAFTAIGWASDAGEEFATGYSIAFSKSDTPDPTHPFIADYLPSLTVDATAFAAVDDLPDTASAYSEDLGYPAYQDVSQEAGREVDKLLVFDFFGFGLTITPVDMPGTATKEERLSLAADIFRTITAYPDAAGSHEAWGDPIAA